ncbi:Hypothetical_protein [Hexamita inflata]|uniref:Hypothetical_protein n=1 Tax=Hexamita inflata TaxID=28002 RepID=A0AA86NLD1_9EUKA|nr:Hypothetical protein HINF_LOCUS9193 [Hexamita inflata]
MNNLPKTDSEETTYYSSATESESSGEDQKFIQTITKLKSRDKDIMPAQPVDKKVKVDKYAHLKKETQKEDNIPQARTINMHEGIDVDEYLNKILNTKLLKVKKDIVINQEEIKKLQEDENDENEMNKAEMKLI